VRFDDPEVREVLAHSMILRLAALSPKGQPNIRCLWFVCRQGRIYIFTADITPIGRGISEHPEVALLFDGERGPQSSRILLVRGRAIFRRRVASWRGSCWRSPGNTSSPGRGFGTCWLMLVGFPLRYASMPSPGGN